MPVLRANVFKPVNSLISLTSTDTVQNYMKSAQVRF